MNTQQLRGEQTGREPRFEVARAQFGGSTPYCGLGQELRPGHRVGTRCMFTDHRLAEFGADALRIPAGLDQSCVRVVRRRRTEERGLC